MKGSYVMLGLIGVVVGAVASNIWLLLASGLFLLYINVITKRG